MRKATIIVGIAGVALGALAGTVGGDPEPTVASTDACREAVGLYQQEVDAFAAEHGRFAVAAEQLSQDGDVTAFLTGMAAAAKDTADQVTILHPQAAAAAARCLGDDA